MFNSDRVDRAKKPQSIFTFMPELFRHKRIFFDAYVASILLHIIGLTTPLFFQAVIDKVIVHNARSTLITLSVGIVLAIIFDACFSLAHDCLLLHANPKIDMQVTARVFRHALSLPLPFFEKHQAGSLVRDMQQDQSVRRFLTEGLFYCLTELTALS